MLLYEDLTYKITGCVQEVYKELGYGYDEKNIMMVLCGSMKIRGKYTIML